MNKPLIDHAGEVRELDSQDFAKFRPASEVLGADFMAMVGSRGRPRKDKHKISTTLRLDQKVIDYFKADGKGYQTRINQALLEYIAAHS
ncbi:BrnA antitoxin family protein [Moraxella marmotae]|uniref:BrnA antitoxin family protein n=1 Tax=Moraxella marmotae TaxID=3344520 RepID=UPI0035F3D7BB